MVIAEVEAGPPDASGRRRPLVTERTSKLACDKVLLALGQKSELDLLPDGWTMREGRAFEGDTLLPVWFAGDCSTGDGTVTHAIGNGRRAALAVLPVPTMRQAKRAQPNRGAGADPLFAFRRGAAAPRQAICRPSAFAGNFEEVNLGLKGRGSRALFLLRPLHALRHLPDLLSGRRDLARRETGYRIDGDYCKGCGMCVAECPRSAMEMQEKNGVRA